jgi:MoxR-like ATPase
LLPSDITGSYILDQAKGSFELREGPIFAQIILGDEINRAPPKTQSALLEAMAEGQVTLEGQTRTLKQPFMVVATQNPVEHEGTYALPEAQLDRFLMKLYVSYPEPAAEKQMLRTYSQPRPTARTVLSPQAIIELQAMASRVHLDDEVLDYVLDLIHFTRRHRRVAIGASPRAALALLHAARARALMLGRDYVLPDDVKALAPPVMAHRLMLIPEAEMEAVSPVSVVQEALSQVAVRPSEQRRSKPAIGSEVAKPRWPEGRFPTLHTNGGYLLSGGPVPARPWVWRSGSGRSRRSGWRRCRCCVLGTSGLRCGCRCCGDGIWSCCGGCLAPRRVKVWSL